MESILKENISLPWEELPEGPVRTTHLLTASPVFYNIRDEVLLIRLIFVFGSYKTTEIQFSSCTGFKQYV